MSEAQFVGELLRLRRSSIWSASGAPPGYHRPLILAGGFGLPTATLAPLARWLRAGDWDVHIADLGWNAGCGEQAVAQLEALIGSVAIRGKPVTLIGHSRGGLLGRVAGVRAQEKLATLVTVCTPWTVGPPDRLGVKLAGRAIRQARALGYRGLGSIDCATAPCCASLRVDVDEKPSAMWTLLWSRADSVVGHDWRTNGPDAIVDIGTSHLGAVLSEPAWVAIGNALRLPPRPR